MMIKMLLRHMREGVKNLIRNGWMTFASVSAVAITLLILGVSLVIALNAQRMSGYVAGQLEVSVLLEQKIPDTQGQQIANQIKLLPGVKSAQFVTKAQGFQDLEKQLGPQYADIMKGIQNPLPDKVIVKAVDPQQTLEVAQEIRSVPGVATVKDGQSFIPRFFQFMNLLRNIGIVFIGALVVTALFLISNTIKITIFSRRREIEIMKLVGATNWFIRWPFLTEGMIIGTIGAAIPLAVILYAYHAAFVRMGGFFVVLTFPLITTTELAFRLIVVLLGLGLFLGVWGGVMSVRKFLRV
ncbi:MAG: hypothetical protein A2201_03555 [Alicyclobacillus sp. RIFOXYA1_FULL_53_8]|nr:MAG: hypothetical protein A2201_03555 [Alicyclobacillus sp. RIFOXYA1_FULL_53_8]